MRLVLALCIFLPTGAFAQDEEWTLNDDALIFRQHATEVRPGTDRLGRPADVLEIPGSGTIWRTTSDDGVLYDEAGSEEYLCNFLWMSFAAARVRQCYPAGVSPKADAFIEQVERIAVHIGHGAVPPRDLVFMRRAMTPVDDAFPSGDCQKDDEIAAVIDVFQNPQVRDRWAEFLAARPHILLMSRCD